MIALHSGFSTIISTLLHVLVALSTTSATQIHYVHWNTTNPLFQISNTDHIIDVNRGNSKYEYDQVTIFCPKYPTSTSERDAEKYIIYNVSREEYETCRITDANPRIIAVCDKPYKLMFFTITFRSFTPQPGGLEFRPGQDYYFISTSTDDNLLRRIGGRCSSHHMKLVFKVCCNETEKNSIIPEEPTLDSNAIADKSNTLMSGGDYTSRIWRHSSAASGGQLAASRPPPVVAPPKTTRRSEVLHSYKGVHDLYDLHVPSINVKATTKKSKERKKHPNDIAVNEELTSSASAATTHALAVCVCVCTWWWFLLAPVWRR